MLRILLLLASIPVAAVSAEPTPLYAEQYRPQFHFSPPRQWMNDPNGLVYFRGEYHLFYQHNPGSTRWGPMHWGHAVSRDTVHWKNLPIALYPDVHGAIFSGSIVADRANTSGFGTRRNPPLVAMFTYHDHEREALKLPGYESQGLAFSLDAGRTWTKYAGNPVLESPQAFDFRDPQVSWHAPSQRWIAVLAAKDHVAFYSSADLKHWRHESDFGQRQGSHEGVWECPGLVSMPLGKSAGKKSVLLVSVGAGGPNGGTATQYFVGDFDGHMFSLDPAQEQSGSAGTRWLDYGTDNYAGALWSGAPRAGEKPRMIGWMSNWLYANDVPTERWRSAMTLPRELTLVPGTAGPELRSLPVPELRALRSARVNLDARDVQRPLDLAADLKVRNGQMEIALDLDLRDAHMVTLTFSNEQQERAVFRLDRLRQVYELDREHAGNIAFHPRFAGIQSAPLPAARAATKLLVYLDRSSIEIFVDDGQTVFTTLVFPAVPFDRASLEADSAIRLRSGTVHALRSAWQ